MDYNLVPPTNAWDYADSNAVVSVVDSQGTDISSHLANPSIDANWQTVLSPSQSVNLDFILQLPRQLCGIRLFSLNGRYPSKVAIEGTLARTTNRVMLRSPI